MPYRLDLDVLVGAVKVLSKDSTGGGRAELF